MIVEQNQILPDDQANLQLEKEGYVLFPLLESEQINQLLSFYRTFHPKEGPGMSASAHAPDIAFRHQMSDAIRETVLPALQKFGVKLRVLGGSFISKSPGTTTMLAAHQDWNITDESKFRSFNIWLPLVDSGKANGGIMVLPKSHLLGPNFRGPGIPSFTENVMDIMEQHMLTLEIPAGHALLYDHRLIHASGPNLSDAARVVAVLGALQEEAPMYIYYGTDDGVNVYRCTADFFLSNNPNEGPGTLPLLAKIPCDTKSPDRKGALGCLHQAGITISTISELIPAPQKKWWKRLFKH